MASCSLKCTGHQCGNCACFSSICLLFWHSWWELSGHYGYREHTLLSHTTRNTSPQKKTNTKLWLSIFFMLILWLLWGTYISIDMILIFNVPFLYFVWNSILFLFNRAFLSLLLMTECGVCLSCCNRHPKPSSGNDLCRLELFYAEESLFFF